MKQIVRTLKDMKEYFIDEEAVKLLLKKNPIIYTVESHKEGLLSVSNTIINPGKVGAEYFMTKGHYHENPSGEAYVLIRGEGKIVMQKGKDCCVVKLDKKKPYLVPAGWAHRTVNTGKGKLEFLNFYPTKAGHDYNKLKKAGGFKKRVTKTL